MTTFDHERLEVYHIAIEFVALADTLVDRFSPGRSYLGDQLHRAATSVALNIAEGAGEFSKRDKARFYRMALRSAMECAAVLDILRVLKLGQEAHLLSGREMLLRVVSMLVRLVRSVGSSGTGTGTEKARGGP